MEQLPVMVAALFFLPWKFLRVLNVKIASCLMHL